MDLIKKFLYFSLLVLSTGMIIITMLSLVNDLRFWFFKMLDFPRIQYLILGILFLFIFILVNKKWKYPSLLLILGLTSVVIVHGIVVYPYLFGRKSVPDVMMGIRNADNTFDVLLANVLITNRKSGAFLEIVKQQDPDILLAMEVDDWWIKELQVLHEKYPYRLALPLDNAYGMSLYSKLPMEDKKIKFLKHHDVPSYHVIMTLPSGKTFNFHGLHPVAPVPSRKYPDSVGEEELTLYKTGKLVAEDPLPSIVAGDFNDVPWSHTTRMFGKQGNLKNVMNGRGLYNTFDATSVIMRWPLDHYFVTKEFKLVELEKLSKFGSDHYPLYARFVLEP